jgi:hypothetical protein
LDHGIKKLSTTTNDRTQHKNIHGMKVEETKLLIEGFCNSDYAGDQYTRKSVSRYVIYVMGCLVAISKITKDILFVKQILEYI